MAGGREKLIDAAQELFTTRTADQVSQQEILALAGQRNQSAIQYHFGSMEGLRAAVFERSLEDINRRRLEILDEVTAPDRTTDLRDIAQALVLPLSEHVMRGKAGRRYLRLLADAMRSPGVRSSEFIRPHSDGLERAQALLRQTMRHVPPAIMTIRLYVVTWTVVGSLSEWDNQDQHPERTERFVAELVNMVAAMLDAPISDAKQAARKA